MAPKKRTTRASPATTTTTTTPATNAQIKASIDQGVVDALAEHDVDRSMNGNDNHNSRMGSRRKERTARECTYTDFLKCQPLNFKDTKGVVGLIIALMWWNSHVKTVTHDVAYAMTWKTLKKMMTNKYCPRGKIKKLEIEMQNLKVNGTNVISTLAERQVENKRKLDNNNQAQQQLPKKQGVTIAYTDGSSERKEYAGTLPSPATANNQRNITCYECGNQGHYRSSRPKLKNRNHENQAGGTRARRMVHASGGGETNQDLNNMEDDINA
nr:hypothetical protein [Tanacetum cinerariifolium]